MISYRNASLFCEQLATLLGAGVPLDQALTTLGRSAPSPGLRRITADLKRRINAGETFAGALAAHAGSLPPLMIGLLDVGERTGRLTEVARSLAAYYESQWQLVRSTTARLLPTLFYLAVCLALIVFIHYVRSGWDTASLARAGENAAFIVACAVLVYAAIKLIAPVRAAFVFVASHVPVASGIMHHYAVSRFALSMHAALGAGLDVRRAIQLSADAMANPVLGPRARRAARDIDEGLTITEALARTRVFARDTMGLIEAGELSGRIVETMEHIAESSRFRAATAARAATKILTIAVYVAVVLFIAYNVISLWSQHYGRVFDLLESGGE